MKLSRDGKILSAVIAFGSVAMLAFLFLSSTRDDPMSLANLATPKSPQRDESQASPVVPTSSATAPSSSSHAPNVTDPKRESIEYQLAYLDAGKMIDREDSSVKRIGVLLDRLVKATGESRADIADQTVKAATVAHEDGKALTNLRLLEEMKEFYSTPGIGKMKVKYRDAAVMYLAANSSKSQ